jgi:hypothetical protein
MSFAYVGKKTSDGGYRVGVDRERGKVVDFVVGACSQEAVRRYKVERFYKLIRLFWFTYLMRSNF